MHQDRLSGLGLCAHDERLVRREVGRAEGGALREAQPLVQREDVGGLADEELGVRAGVPAGGEDALANLQVGDGRPHGVDEAGGVPARRVGQLGQAGVLTLPETKRCKGLDIGLG